MTGEIGVHLEQVIRLANISSHALQILALHFYSVLISQP